MWNKKSIFKIEFYFLSLWLLFLIVILLNIDFPIKFDIEYLYDNLASVLSTIGVGLSLWIYCRFDSNVKNIYNPPFVIKEVKNQSFEHIVFLTTYIIPLIAFDLSNLRNVVALVVLLVVIGWIIIKTELYFGNPTLALLGYKLYKVKFESRNDEIMCITKDKLVATSLVKWIELDKGIYVVREVREVSNDN